MRQKTNHLHLRRSLRRLAIGALGFAIPLAVAQAQTTQPTTQPASRSSTQPSKQAIDPIPVNVPPIPAFIRSVKPSGQTVFIHYKTNFDHDDNPGCVAFNVALAARAAGHDVEFHYDAGGVLDLKLWQGRPASYHYEVPQKMRSLLASSYPITPAAMPSTYQEYLHWLHAMGVRITYNGFMAALVDLQPSITERGHQVEPIATPLTFEQIMAHRAAADVYLVY